MQRTGDGRWHFDDVGHGHPITREEIEQLWNMSGAHLHRGSAKRYLRKERDIDFLAITRAKEKIRNLVMDHMIVLSQTSRFHVHVARDSNDISCHFIFLDLENGTATVEPYHASIAEMS